VADEKQRRPGIVAAGRSAVALLRSTGHRAKLGTLHLPISLHPRAQPIVLPSGPSEVSRDSDQPRPAGGDTATPPLHGEVRALRSRLAVAERRNARLRHALQRERLAVERANSIVQNPLPLIDHLAADLSAGAALDEAALRQTITSVLRAYGFGVATSEPQLEPAPASTPAPAVSPAIPGLHRRRLLAITKQLLAEQPEISSPRYIQLPLDALAQQGDLTQSQIVKATSMESPIARRRLRLALEGLCRAGVLRFDGSRYSLSGYTPEQDR
jgi:hypothetical protein